MQLPSLPTYGFYTGRQAGGYLAIVVLRGAEGIPHQTSPFDFPVRETVVSRRVCVWLITRPGYGGSSASAPAGTATRPPACFAGKLPAGIQIAGCGRVDEASIPVRSLIHVELPVRAPRLLPPAVPLEGFFDFPGMEFDTIIPNHIQSSNINTKQ